MIPTLLALLLQTQPVHHRIFGLAPATYCVTQDTLAVGRFTAGAAGDLVFEAPAASPISIVVCPAGMRPSVAGVE